jgi:NAD(P)-dependent dehydrogenase (short-subunit alcohol dehydrogenase family)
VTSLDGKVILVTGATDGLGRALSADLARSGATVLVHGRDAGRIADTVAEIGGGNVRAYQADLADLAQVSALADRVLASEPRLDVLVNNAGIGTDVPGGGVRQESVDGYELRFAVNYLAGFALTERLLPLLESSAPSRIVNVSSLGQQAIDFDDVMLARDYSGMRAYRQSKLAQILFTIDLAKELVGTGVTVNTLHPATFMNTNMVRQFGTPMSTVEEGADAILQLAVSPEMEGRSGLYFNGQSEAKASEQAYDASARQKLKKLSRELTGLSAKKSAAARGKR